MVARSVKKDFDLLPFIIQLAGQPAEEVGSDTDPRHVTVYTSSGEVSSRCLPGRPIPARTRRPAGRGVLHRADGPAANGELACGGRAARCARSRAPSFIMARSMRLRIGYCLEGRAAPYLG